MARIMPSLYHLLPTCSGINVDPGLPTEIFDPKIWQSSILDTIEEYVRLHAVSKKDRKNQTPELFEGLLNEARSHRNRIEGFKLKQANLTAADWLCVAGVDSITRIGIKVIKGPSFQLRSIDRVNNWKDGGG